MYTDKTCLLLVVITFIKTLKLLKGSQNTGLWQQVSSIILDNKALFYYAIEEIKKYNDANTYILNITEIMKINQII